RRRLYAIAHLAVDLTDQLVGVALEPALVGGRPRLLPHSAPRKQLMGVGGGVRSEREEQRRGRGQRKTQRAGRRIALLALLGDRVGQLHDGRDGRVVGEASGHVVGDLLDRPVRLAQQLLVTLGGVVGNRVVRRLVGGLGAHAPQARQEAVHALHARVG